MATDLDSIINGITSQFGKAAGELAATYLPTLRSMGVKELLAITDLINAGKTSDAQQKIIDAMTLDELAAQKATLAQVTVQMASDNAANAKFWNDMVSACLKVAMTALIPVVGL